MKSALELLKAARERITPPENWCQNEFFRDAHGHAIGWPGAYAPSEVINEVFEQVKSCCADGALIMCNHGMTAGTVYDDASRALNAAAFDVANVGSFVKANDALGHEAILAVFDKAIADIEELT
jgi:hypothetical protein